MFTCRKGSVNKYNLKYFKKKFNVYVKWDFIKNIFIQKLDTFKIIELSISTFNFSDLHKLLRFVSHNDRVFLGRLSLIKCTTSCQYAKII